MAPEQIRGIHLAERTEIYQLGVTLYTTPLKWVLMLAPLGVVFWLSFRVHKMPVGQARALYDHAAGIEGRGRSEDDFAYTIRLVSEVLSSNGSRPSSQGERTTRRHGDGSVTGAS